MDSTTRAKETSPATRKLSTCVESAKFFYILVICCLAFHPVHACPAQCQCTAGPGGGERVVCPPGLTSLPPGLNPNTNILILQGRPLPQGRNNIPVLRRGDFTTLTALEELTLPYAGLSDIEDGALVVLVNLKRLCLHDNQLKKLTPRTFSALTKLDFLDLTNNAGCLIQGDVFSHLTSLKTVYLGGLGLTEVKAGWFKSLSSFESLDLHGNNIETLEPDFLQGLPQMKMLDLTGNQLQTLTPTLQATFTSIGVVYLGDNPWHCNCDLVWLKQIRSPRLTGDAVACMTPPPLAFMDLALVPASHMICLPPKILQCGGPYDVNAGNDVILECQVEGDPFPTVEWSRPDGTVSATVQPSPRVSTRQRPVNSTVVTVADFAVHHGQWSVTARSREGSDTGHLLVNVFTTTTVTTSTTTTPKPTGNAALASYGTPKTSHGSATTKDRDPDPSPLSTGIWFYVAMAAFGITALALTSLILVAAFKIRKNQRQVGTDRRDSGPSVGSDTETDVTIVARSSAGLRDLRSRAM